MAAASGRLSLAGVGGGGGARGWALAMGCQGSSHTCLRARTLGPSGLSLRALVSQSLEQRGKLRLREMVAHLRSQQRQSLAQNHTFPQDHRDLQDCYCGQGRQRSSGGC